jgi:hypothetical protein
MLSVHIKSESSIFRSKGSKATAVSRGGGDEKKEREVGGGK